MTWGSGTWGSMYWGAPGDFASAMARRLLMFVQGDPTFRGLTLALANRTELLLTAARTVANAFDLDTAVGAQLDRIGGIVQRPRFGLDDDRYRSLLRAHIDLILSSSGGAETLLAVFLAWTGAQATEYQEHYPAQFTIGGFVEIEEVAFLRSLLQQAKGWGMVGGLSVAMAEDSDLDGGTLLCDFVADEGVWSAVLDDRTFAARMTSTGADDTETEDAGTLDGTTHVPSFEARNFNGTTDRIDWPTRLDLSLPQPFTVAGWVRFETLAGLRTIFQAASTGPAQSMIVRTNGAALEIAHAYSPGTTLQRISTAVLSTGTWYHVAAVFAGTATASACRLYLSGVEMSYATTTNGSGTPRAADGPWSIGGRIEADGNNTDGDVAAFDVWPRILSNAEIHHLYREGVESGAFAGPPDEAPIVDNPGVLDNVSAAIGGLAYELAHEVTL